MANRDIIGLRSKVKFEDGSTYTAKVDTGADSSSIDKTIFKKLGDKEIAGHKTIRSALGQHKRPAVMLEVEINGKLFKQKFTISDRSNLNFKVLIGCDILKKGEFLVDPLQR